MMEGTRKLIFTILQSALYDAEKKEEALIEIFRAMRDCTEMKKRMMLKKEMGEEINKWEVMEMLTRETKYTQELQPIDVVRQVMQVWMMWSMEDEMTDMYEEKTTDAPMTTLDAATETLEAATEPIEAVTDSSSDTIARKRREAESMTEEEIKTFYEDNMELPESGDMEAFYKMLDIIEQAYNNPIQAKFELMAMMMKGMKEMGADESSLKWMQYQMNSCFARDVLKKFKCYGYAEAYSWNVVGKKMDMISAGTYDDATFMPIADNFTDTAELPKNGELVEMWVAAKDNTYDLEPEQHAMWKAMLMDMTEGIMKTGLTLDQPLCDVKKESAGMGGMFGMMGGMMGGKGGPPMGGMGGKGGPPMGGKPWEKEGGDMKSDMGSMMGGSEDDKMMMMMAMKKKMMETKQEMGQKMDQILNMVTVQKERKFTLWCQMFPDAHEGKFLEMQYGDEAMCAKYDTRFSPMGKIAGLKFDACNSTSDDQVKFEFMGNYLVNENNYGKKTCLTATPNKNLGLDAPFAHYVHMAPCTMTMAEDDGAAFDGESFQHFAHCPYTGKIHLIADTEKCLQVSTTKKGDIRLTTCLCDAGISEAPAFGRRFPEEL
jgi:hypothetical protein